MTSEVFFQRHGERWLIFKRDPMFQDLMNLINEQGPDKQSADFFIDVSTQNAPYILGRIAGWNKLRQLLLKLDIEPQMNALETVYEEDQKL